MKYIDFFDGDLPIILSIPHNGGIELINTNIRIGKEDLQYNGRVIMKNDYEIGRIGKKIQEYFMKMVHLKPYIICNNVNRKYIDVNRQSSYGSESDMTTIIWNMYHNKLDEYIQECLTKFSHCLLIDLHGNSSTYNIIQLGYGTDTIDGEYKNFSLASLKKKYNPYNLLYGHRSLPEMFNTNFCMIVPNKRFNTNEKIKKFSTINHYYYGGFITQYYSKKYNIDTIQIELSFNLRENEKYKETAYELAKALLQFYIINYDIS